MSVAVDLNDLDGDTKRRLGLKNPRQTEFTAEDVSCHAIRALAAIAALSRQERDRVLRHAMKLNKLKIRGA